MQPYVGQQALDQVAMRVVLAPDQAVDVVPLGEQQLGEVETVLAGDPGDERGGHAAQCASRRRRAPLVEEGAPAPVTKPGETDAFPFRGFVTGLRPSSTNGLPWPP